MVIGEEAARCPQATGFWQRANDHTRGCELHRRNL
jgi:hypothetical protein